MLLVALVGREPNPATSAAPRPLDAAAPLGCASPNATVGKSKRSGRRAGRFEGKCFQVSAKKRRVFVAEGGV